MDSQNYIRNFAIVAHIDHGKSTLADRLLEATGTIDSQNINEQVLDYNPIERERGITIKLAPVRMKYKFENHEYTLNLIDTPGHVDFAYEVSRSLSACEGVILVIDATQGIQAQTVAHMHLIQKNKLQIIPAINKIDLDSAEVELVKESIVTAFGLPKDKILEISAKKGINIDKVLKAVIQEIPPPAGNKNAPLKALIFSSIYHPHKGVVIYVRMFDGEINIKDYRHGKIYDKLLHLCATGIDFVPIEVGFFNPQMKSGSVISAGDVGYIATGLKELSLAQVGDTVTFNNTHVIPLPGYKDPKPMVFLSLYPIDNDKYMDLRLGLEKLHLSDSSYTYKPHSSLALGKGFLCGFLGLLHAEVINERLAEEFDLNVISTTPIVEYKITTIDEKINYIHTPEEFPDPSLIRSIEEPMMLTTIYSPAGFVGVIMQLCEKRRAQYIDLEYVAAQAKFTYIIPLSEMIIDFFDQLKSISEGYASLDYEFYEYRKIEAVKIDILLNKIPVDAFSHIIVKENVLFHANKIVVRLKNLIPRHQFEIPIQAVIGGKVIARSDVKAFRKDVTQKLYGGDRTRKDKLLEAQKKGKKRLKRFGRVEIPQEVFLKLYKVF